MNSKTSTDPRYRHLLDNLWDLIAPLEQIQRQAVAVYAPIVEDILRAGLRDVRHIENTLDGLLDFCGYAPALLLYRRLCRYYFGLDPAAAGHYVNAYREIYDEGATRFRG